MGGRESQRLIVPLKRGNQPEGPRRGKEVPSHEPLKGNMPGTLRPEPCPRNDDGSRGSRIHEMRNRVRVMCKPGSVGGLGGRPSRSTRPKAPGPQGPPDPKAPLVTISGGQVSSCQRAFTRAPPFGVGGTRACFSHRIAKDPPHDPDIHSLRQCRAMLRPKTRVRGNEINRKNRTIVSTGYARKGQPTFCHQGNAGGRNVLIVAHPLASASEVTSWVEWEIRSLTQPGLCAMMNACQGNGGDGHA